MGDIMISIFLKFITVNSSFFLVSSNRCSGKELCTPVRSMVASTGSSIMKPHVSANAVSKSGIALKICLALQECARFYKRDSN